MGIKSAKLGLVGKHTRGVADMYVGTSEAISDYRSATSRGEDVELSVDQNKLKGDSDNE